MHLKLNKTYALNWRLKLLFFATFLAVNVASANPCAKSFDSKWKEVLLERVEKLDPTFSQEINNSFNKASLENEELIALLILKEREFEFSTDYTMKWPVKKTLTKNNSTLLVSNFSNEFNLSELSEDELLQFYSNSIRQIYLWLGTVALKNLARGSLYSVGFDIEKFDSQNQKIASLIALDLIGSNWLDRATSPKLLFDMLSAKSWLNTDWKSIGLILSGNSTSSHPLVLKAQNTLNDEKPICCNTAPGCRTCPINTRNRIKN